MAKGDIRIFDVGGLSNVPVRTFRVIANATAINAGEPVLIANRNTSVIDPYVIVLIDGKPLVGTDYFIGIAANAGSHTASADGTVDVYLDCPGMVYAAKAKTTTTFNTTAKINDFLFYRVVFDLTSSTYTLDNTTTAATAGLQIWGGDPNTYTVYFATSDAATWRGLNG